MKPTRFTRSGWLRRCSSTTVPLVAAAAAVASLTACGSGDTANGASPPKTGGPGQTESISIRLDAPFLSAHVPLLAGIEEGIFKKHGLKITANPGNGSGTTIQLIDHGTESYGFADGGTLATALTGGATKTRMIFGELQTSPMVIITRESAGITKPTDLNGKQGGFTAGSSIETLFPAFANKTGVDVNSIKKLSANLATRDSLFVQGRTQFTFGFRNVQVPNIEAACRCKLSVMQFADYGINPMASGFIVNSDYAAKNSEQVKKFATAMQESVKFAVDNPEKAVDDFYKYAGSSVQTPKPILAQGWEIAREYLHTDATKSLLYGCMSDADWQRTIGILENYRGVPKGALKPSGVYTNEYLAGC